MKWLSLSLTLTPTLSLREREKRSLRLGERKAACCSMISTIYDPVQWVFPLPEGEGQGEGEAPRKSNRPFPT
jgi:hypothetical protein